MAENNNAAEVRGDYSIGELRGMLSGETKKEAAPAAKSESGRDSGTEEKPAGKAERSGDRKFKAAKEKDGEGEKPEPEAEDGPQKRINKAVKAQREAERKAEQLAKEIEELKKGKPAAEPKKDEKKEPAKAASGKPRPKQEDFTTYEEYTEALTDWKLDEREAKKDAEKREREQAEANKAFLKVWETKKHAARDKYDDYDDVMEEHGKTPVNQATHNFITESDIGPELGYYLATHRDEAAEIAKMTPTKAVKAMAKIEDSLEASSEKTAPAEDKKPKAEKKELPKPPRNVGGSATPKESKLDDPDIDMGTFKRIARAHLNRER